MITMPYLVTLVLLCAGGSGEEWSPSSATPVPSPSPSCTPTPSPTPRIIPVELYFRRPARIIPLHNQEEEFEVAQEVPWLAEEDIAWVSPRLDAEHPSLRLYLTPAGKQKYREALMGNVGRTIIFTIDGTVRYTALMEPVREKNQIDFHGEFTPEETEQIIEQIKIRPVPTPTPAPTPTPPREKQFIIE